jgi:hypothetical protein
MQNGLEVVRGPAQQKMRGRTQVEFLLAAASLLLLPPL